jgi:lysyl-tRNA synthetase class 2
MQQLRDFFASKQILEVNTPLLSQATVSNPYIASFMVPYANNTYYLQTSPEYAMKRLLAAGSGAIYQICQAFRQDRPSRLHNYEFSILEWYRPGLNHQQLMDEVAEMLCLLLPCQHTERLSYQELFSQRLALNPHTATLKQLQKCAAQLNFTGDLSRDGWLELLMSHLIEPQLGTTVPVFIYDFPASQAALAKIIPVKPDVAARFEVYYRGVELGNGFYELQDSQEQRRRFEQELMARQAQQLPIVPIDENLLAALDYGLPDCSGIAIGLERLMMLALGCNNIAEVMSFDSARA